MTKNKICLPFRLVFVVVVVGGGGGVVVATAVVLTEKYENVLSDMKQISCMYVYLCHMFLCLHILNDKYICQLSCCIEMILTQEHDIGML